MRIVRRNAWWIALVLVAAALLTLVAAQAGASARRGINEIFDTAGRSSEELVERAFLGALVVAPAEERRRVAEPVALHLVVADLAHELGAERRPGLLLGPRPPRRPAGSPSLAERLRLHVLVLLQHPAQTLAFGGRERRCVPHEVEHPVPVQPEQ